MGLPLLVLTLVFANGSTPRCRAFPPASHFDPLELLAPSPATRQFAVRLQTLQDCPRRGIDSGDCRAQWATLSEPVIGL